jgi:hypothetical protein
MDAVFHSVIFDGARNKPLALRRATDRDAM